MGAPVVGFIGGTGPQGSGLALRLAMTGRPVMIGSRDPERARQSVDDLRRDGAAPMTGAGNLEVAEAAELVFLTVPWSGHLDTLRAVGPALDGKILVDVVNPLTFDKAGPYSLDVDAGSAAEESQEAVPAARVVSGFHDVSARRLLDIAQALDTDVLICGDDADAKDVVLRLTGEVPGLRGVDVGPLRLSRHLEGMTAVLLSVNRARKVQAGIRLTGL
ncbi:MAG: NADPH-dependent F420 reductase [Acidimicrobiia bacterium]